MTETKTWRDKLPLPLASVAENDLWWMAIAFFGAILAGLGLKGIFDRSFLFVLCFILAVLGALLVILAVAGIVRDPSKRHLRFHLRTLKADSEYLLNLYQRLDYENRDRVRFPLSASSWPRFGEVWDDISVYLYSAQEAFINLSSKARLLWEELGRSDTPRICKLQNTATMLELTDALEDFRNQVQQLLSKRT
jgi:hypothetical protein